jgi:hypothetical protein
MAPPDARVTLRLPADLAALLRTRATADHRSLNSQIVFLLEQALYTVVDADAYADKRGALNGMPASPHLRPNNRRSGNREDS